MANLKKYDVVIIGGGPAGIQSAVSLQNNGLSIALIDENLHLGGQIYKNIEKNNTEKNKTLFKKDYFKGLELLKKFDKSEIDYIPSADVWSIDKDKNIFYSKDEKSFKIYAEKIIIATGSMERPFPVKGWTLPGVLGATSAQIMLKEASLIKDNAVFVGSGPLFYYVIAQYLDAGAKIKAIIDTTPLENYKKAIPYFIGALSHMDQLIKGVGFFYKFAKKGIKIHRFVKDIHFEGNDELSSVVFDGQKINTKIAFIHNGLAPNINLQLEAGCKYEFSENTRTIDIVTNENMQTSVEGIYAIGDGKSVRGVEVSKAEAIIVASEILDNYNKTNSKNIILKNDALKVLKHYSKLRKFLDALYLPSHSLLSPQKDTTIVCRCEEVTYGNLKNSLSIDNRGSGVLKNFTRAGMGNCQGRFCGLTLLEVIAKETGANIKELKYLNIRPPVKPIRLNEMLDI